jgi:ATP synthase protein I
LQVTYVERPGAPPDTVDNGMDSYARLQRRLLLATAAMGVLVSLLTLVLRDWSTAASVLVGSLAGVLYLRLLARTVSRLGGSSRQLGRFQLVVPILLVVGVSRTPSLELLPAILGFLLYKPALLLQAILDR